MADLESARTPVDLNTSTSTNPTTTTTSTGSTASEAGWEHVAATGLPTPTRQGMLVMHQPHRKRARTTPVVLTLHGRRLLVRPVTGTPDAGRSRSPSPAPATSTAPAPASGAATSTAGAITLRTKRRLRAPGAALCGLRRSREAAADRVGFLLDVCELAGGDKEANAFQVVVRTVRASRTWTFATNAAEKLAWLRCLKAALSLGQLSSWVVPPSRVELDLDADVLGRGATGFVHRATLDGRTQAAAKCFRDTADVDPLVVAEFINEACILARLQGHPAFARLFGVTVLSGAVANSHLLLMEYCPRGSLTARLHTMRGGLPVGPRAPLTLDEYLRIGRELCAGVAFLHRKNIAHRDLKPDNLLFARSGALKIVDFGISREASDRCMTANIGTLLWCAPEVMSAAPGDLVSRLRAYSTSCDCYSVGIILWQMLARRLPYASVETNWELRRLVQDGSLRPRLDPAWPHGLRTLIKWCWFSVPDGRPTAAQVLEVLSDRDQALGPAFLDNGSVFGSVSPSPTPDGDPGRAQSPIGAHASPSTSPASLEIRQAMLVRRQASGQLGRLAVIRNCGRRLPTPPIESQLG